MFDCLSSPQCCCMSCRAQAAEDLADAEAEAQQPNPPIVMTAARSDALRLVTSLASDMRSSSGWDSQQVQNLLDAIRLCSLV